MQSSLQQQSLLLLKQIYHGRNKSLYKPIRLNATTRISEMIPLYQKRIVKHKNRMIEHRMYITNARKAATRFRPMHYTKVLCHACYQEIELKHLYLSKNGEHGRSKFYHITCAERKHILVLD